MHLFPYKWNLADGYPAKGFEPNGCKVFGTFICGGGSTMGYKLAGYTHLGGVEIDPKVADVYQTNHKPAHFFLEDIRLFNQRTDLPKELFNLDLLDGSPPCSSFSMAGNREKDWGKEKVFREGEELQRLDDLVFEYVETIGKLKPKVALLENVKGLIIGNAKAYAKEIKKRFEAKGYKVQLFLLNAASMGVPQRRERVFFVGIRKEYDLPKLKLDFREKAVLFGEIKDKGSTKKLTEYQKNILKKATKLDNNFGDVNLRLIGKNSSFSAIILHKNNVMQTITANNKSYNFQKKCIVSDQAIKMCGTYPLEYNFKGIEPKYLIGMSVPPVMTAQIANQIWLQWLSKINQ